MSESSNPSGGITSVSDCLYAAEHWIAGIQTAVSTNNVNAFVDCFEEDGWFRDLLVFTWDFKTRHGHDAIHAYLANTLTKAQLSNFRLDLRHHFAPHLAEFGPNNPLIEAALTFETPKAMGQGFVRLRVKDGMDKPRAFSVVLKISDWKGHEESTFESGIYDGHRLTWDEVRLERRHAIEQNPDVVIGMHEFHLITLYEG